MRQKLDDLQLASTNLNSMQQNLRQNAQLIQDTIYKTSNNQIKSIMDNEEKLRKELNEKIMIEETQILKKQQDLYVAIGICQQALQTSHTTQQLNETLTKLNSLDLEPFRMKNMRFEANSNGSIGQIVSESKIRKYKERAYSFDSSEMDDDFEIVNIVNSPAHKWLLKSNGAIQKESLSDTHSKSNGLKRSTNRKMDNFVEKPKPSQSFEEVIRSIQLSPNHKWILNSNLGCSHPVENMSQILKNLHILHSGGKRVAAPLIMHHV